MTPRAIPPIRRRIDARVRVPASKSVANRELILSAQADGRSVLDLGPFDPGADVRAMREAIGALGYRVEWDGRRITVEGTRDAPTPVDGSIDAADAGTVARFLTALAALGRGRVTIDGSVRLRQRPLAALLVALRTLGATVEGDALPLTVNGPLAGGDVEVSGAESSQFASALLLVGAGMPQGLRLRISGTLVSAPFVSLTVAALRQRDVEVEHPRPGEFHVRPQRVRARRLEIPGDATAATYPAAAAAILGGSVTVEDVDAKRADGGQGDVRFFDLLEEMGCGVDRRGGRVRVSRSGSLHGIVANVRDCSDVFPTLAAIAACAETPTELAGISHTRQQESDRIGAVALALRALGAGATEFTDTIRIEPGPLHGAIVDAADDHRIAMAFSILGLHVPGIAIDGAESVAKTFPGFYDTLRDLSR
ncbi:MAG: 3-phosphoshikimate 1-carboxyvinyltransferase [Candidatus Limnocylindria bacterium]